jgi:hypothetical protein
MAAWTRDQLDRIASADELDVVSLGRDGMLGDSRTIWVVRVGGVEKDVTFVQVDDDDLADRIDDEYRSKYERYAANIVGHTVTAEARSSTLKLAPRP